MQIPLKRKYRVGGKSRYQGGENAAPRKHRNKLGYEKHVKLFGQPKVMHLVVDGKTGAGVMVEVK